MQCLPPAQCSSLMVMRLAIPLWTYPRGWRHQPGGRDSRLLNGFGASQESRIASRCTGRYETYRPTSYQAGPGFESLIHLPKTRQYTGGKRK